MPIPTLAITANEANVFSFFTLPRGDAQRYPLAKPISGLPAAGSTPSRFPHAIPCPRCTGGTLQHNSTGLGAATSVSLGAALGCLKARCAMGDAEGCPLREGWLWGLALWCCSCFGSSTFF